MANTKGQRGASGKKPVKNGGKGVSQKDGRFVAAQTSERERSPKSTKAAKTAAGSALAHVYSSPPVVTQREIEVRAIPRRAIIRANADERQVVRLAKAAAQARIDPGEDLSGLSREEFLARLLG